MQMPGTPRMPNDCINGWNSSRSPVSQRIGIAVFSNRSQFPQTSSATQEVFLFCANKSNGRDLWSYFTSQSMKKHIYPSLTLTSLLTVSERATLQAGFYRAQKILGWTTGKARLASSYAWPFSMHKLLRFLHNRNVHVANIDFGSWQHHIRTVTDGNDLKCIVASYLKHDWSKWNVLHLKLWQSISAISL